MALDIESENMFLIITMAGRYQRFLDEGFKTPKYLLPWGEHTILSVILSELNKDKLFSDVFLVANQRDDAYMPHVRAVMKSQNVNINNLILTNDTTGQAETAFLGVKALEVKHGEIDVPVVIHNIDTILLNRSLENIQATMKENAGYIDIFGANNKAYSYVLINQNNNVIEIAEKIVVSDLATSGLYAFKSTKIFKKYAAQDDIYISSMFKRMIMNGENISVSNKHKESETIVLGTPVQYMNSSFTMI